MFSIFNSNRQSRCSNYPLVLNASHVFVIWGVRRGIILTGVGAKDCVVRWKAAWLIVIGRVRLFGRRIILTRVRGVNGRLCSDARFQRFRGSSDRSSLGGGNGDWTGAGSGDSDVGLRERGREDWRGAVRSRHADGSVQPRWWRRWKGGGRQRRHAWKWRVDQRDRLSRMYREYNYTRIACCLSNRGCAALRWSSLSWRDWPHWTPLRRIVPNQMGCSENSTPPQFCSEEEKVC